MLSNIRRRSHRLNPCEPLETLQDHQFTLAAAELAKNATDMKLLMSDMSALLEMQTVDLGIADDLIAESKTSTTDATESIVAASEANKQPMVTAIVLAIIGMCTLGPLGGVLGGTLGTIGGVSGGAFVGVAYYSAKKESR